MESAGPVQLLHQEVTGDKDLQLGQAAPMFHCAVSTLVLPNSYVKSVILSLNLFESYDALQRPRLYLV
jgi:hypothetical protein